MEKNGSIKIIIMVVLVLLLAVASYILYDKVFEKKASSVNSEKVNNNDKNSNTTEEKELDINSRLVRSLYNKVTTDSDRSDYLLFWRYNNMGTEYNPLANFDINTAQEVVKMQLVAHNLKDGYKEFLLCSANNIPAQTVAGYACGDDYTYGYSREYIEFVYKDLYGSEQKLDKSVIVYLDEHGVTRLFYIEAIDMYVVYSVEGGGTSGPSGYSSKISKAVKNNDTIKIYQDVILTNYKQDADGAVDLNDESLKIKTNYNMVYTFKLDSDGMYSFISREKVK